MVVTPELIVDWESFSLIFKIIKQISVSTNKFHKKINDKINTLVRLFATLKGLRHVDSFDVFTCTRDSSQVSDLSMSPTLDRKSHILRFLLTVTIHKRAWIWCRGVRQIHIQDSDIAKDWSVTLGKRSTQHA